MFNPTEVKDFDLILDVIAKDKNPKGMPKTLTKNLISQKC
jgi:hypothetical protein